MVLYANEARTADPTPRTIDRIQGQRGCHCILDVTAVTATGSVQVTIEGKIPGTDKWYQLGQGAAETTTGTTRYTIYPGRTEAANVDFDEAIPAQYRVTVTHGNGVAMTYSVSLNPVY